MAFTDALDVDVGDATKASDYDTLADNTEFNREKGDVDHDFDISTGDGYHKASSDAAMHLVSVTEDAAATIWVDSSGNLRVKAATSTTTPPTPSSETDGTIAAAPSGASPF